MVTGVLVVNIHKAAPNVHRAVAGCLSHPKGHRQYDTALTALEKCQKTQESPLYNPRVYPSENSHGLTEGV